MRIVRKFNRAYSILPSPDGKYICTFSGGTVKVYSSADLSEYAAFTKLKYVSSLCFHMDSNLMAAKSTTGEITLFDFHKKSLIRSFRFSKKPGQDCNAVFSPDGKYLVCIAHEFPDNYIVLIDICSGQMSEPIGFSNTGILSAWYEEENTLCCALSDRNHDISQFLLFKWEYPFLKGSHRLVEPNFESFDWRNIDYNMIKNQYSILLKGKDDNFDNDVLITEKNLRGEISRASVGGLINGDGYPVDVKWSNNGKFIVVCFSEVVKILDSSTLDCVESIKMKFISSACFSKNDDYLLVGTFNTSYILDHGLIGSI